MDKFGIKNIKPVKVPMLANGKTNPDPEAKLANITQYMGIISSLLYLTTSQSDITFAVGVCARFQTNPKESLLEATKKIL